MRSGRLRSRVKILKPEGRNSFGEVSEKSIVIANKFCEVNVISDTEITGDRRTSNKTLEFKTRYSKQIECPSSDMFIEFKGECYDIISVINYRELNKWLTIRATKRG